MWNKYEWAIFIVSFLLIASFTKTWPISPNDQSRLNGVQSIVEQGTFAIDDSKFNWTIDRVKIGNHFYSDKAAMSYLVYVPIYYLLFNQGYSIENNINRVYFLLTLTVIGISTSIMLVYFFRLLNRYKISTGSRIFYTTALGLGTLIFPYSLIINNHGLAAAFLFFSFYSLINAKKIPQFAIAGLLVGLTATFETVTGPIFMMCFVILLIWRKCKIKNLSTYLLCAALPIIVYLSINYSIGGNIVPVQLNQDNFNYPGSAFGGDRHFSLVRWDSFTRFVNYVYDLTVGGRGFFSITPLLLFAIAGILITVLSKNDYRDESIAMLFGVLLAFSTYLVQTIDWGGCSFGFRHTVPLIPILFVYIPTVFTKYKDPYLKFLFFLAFIVSLFMTWMGIIQHSWSCSPELIPNITLKEMLERLYNSLAFWSLK